MSSNLDDILNDALNDFDFEGDTKAAINTAPTSTAAPAKPETTSTSSAAPSTASPANAVPKPELGPNMNDWASDFLSKLGSDDPEIKQLMEQMNSAFSTLPGASSDGSSASSSSVPLPDMPDIDMESPDMKLKLAELQKMLADVENGEESDDVLDKILEATGMSNMMQQLMSKDVLLEPFKDMDVQYTSWLKENTEIAPADKDRYHAQHALVKKIIIAYESSSNESTEVVAALISEMQALGDPPQSMLQGMLPDLKFDDNGKPIM